MARKRKSIPRKGKSTYRKKRKSIANQSRISGSKKNQTNPEWLTAENLSSKGTGIFLMPTKMPTKMLSRPGYKTRPRYRNFSKRFIENLTYESVVAYGSRSLVFKWVPNSVASYQELTNQPCGQPCIKTCATLGCVCKQGKCR